MKEDKLEGYTLEELDKLHDEDIEKFNQLPNRVKILYRVSRISNILGETSKDSIDRGLDVLKDLSTKRS